MRMTKRLITLGTLFLLAVTFGCGGSGGGDGGGSSTGTVALSMTDAKPMLPEVLGKEIISVFVEIDDVLVHMPGGGWKSLAKDMVENPYRIDLMEFSNGISSEFVPPVPLDKGKYTQIRLSVTKATLRLLDLDTDTTQDVPITIPSDNLKTDKNFDFEVAEGETAAVDITIDFDLSQSLVLEGAEYKLKPVLHIVDTEKAATINVTFDNSKLTDQDYVIITVKDQDKQVYTEVRVDKATGTTTTFSIFWLVPRQAYTVEIVYNPKTTSPVTDSIDVGEVDGIATVTFP
jgi:Domain of unknown function (DUF4382)